MRETERVRESEELDWERRAGRLREWEVLYIYIYIYIYNLNIKY